MSRYCLHCSAVLTRHEKERLGQFEKRIYCGHACANHYQAKAKPIADLFWAMVPDQPGADCWEWAGARDENGYGRVSSRTRRDDAAPRQMLAHRLSYELNRGPIPKGIRVCHACDNPPCINPQHLFLGTQADNMNDMTKKGRHGRYNSLKTHCKHGHPFSPENTRTRNGERICIACTQERTRYHNGKRKRALSEQLHQGR